MWPQQQQQWTTTTTTTPSTTSRTTRTAAAAAAAAEELVVDNSWPAPTQPTTRWSKADNIWPSHSLPQSCHQRCLRWWLQLSCFDGHCQFHLGECTANGLFRHYRFDKYRRASSSYSFHYTWLATETVRVQIVWSCRWRINPIRKGYWTGYFAI